MTIFGIGGFELLLIGVVALFVLGPKRLLGGIRELRRIYSEFKRQRDTLQSMVTEAIDLDELKRQVQLETLSPVDKELGDESTLDQISDDLSSVEELIERSVAHADAPEGSTGEIDNKDRDESNEELHKRGDVP